MDESEFSLPGPSTILSGPFWQGPVRVLRAHVNGPSIRIEAVGVQDSRYDDTTLTLEQFQNQATGKIAVKVINHYGDEVLKVYEV